MATHRQRDAAGRDATHPGGYTNVELRGRDTRLLVPGQPKILSISAKGNPIDVTPRKGSQHVKKVPIPPQVPLRSTRNLLLEEYVFSMHQIGDLYKDIIVRESVKGRRGIGVHEQ